MYGQFSFLHTVEQSYSLYVWECCLSLTHTHTHTQNHHHHHHHHLHHHYIANVELTHSSLTCLEVFLLVSPCFFSLLVCSFLVLSVLYYRTFCSYVATNFCCIAVFCLKHACPQAKVAVLPLDLPCCGP
jgi:hypothetical protein